MTPASSPSEIGGGDERAALHDEDVLPRALHDVAGRAEQDRLVVAGLQGGDLGQGGVHVLPRALARRRDRVLVDVLPTRGHRPAAGLQRVGAEVEPPRPHRDRDLDVARQRVEPHLAVAEVDDRPHVAGLDLVDPDGLLGRGDDLRRREARVHQVDRGRPEQPVDVVGEPEDRGALRRPVRPDALEDTPAVVQRGVQDVYGRVVPVDEAPVHPDLLGRRDRHGPTPLASPALRGRPTIPPRRPAPPPGRAFRAGQPSGAGVCWLVSAARRSPMDSVRPGSVWSRVARSNATAASTRRAWSP